MKTLISIIDELYNTLHIPCVIFDKDLQLIHPKITIIDKMCIRDRDEYDVHLCKYYCSPYLLYSLLDFYALT